MWMHSISVVRFACADDFILRARIRSLRWRYVQWSRYMVLVPWDQQDVLEFVPRIVAVIGLYKRLRWSRWSRSYYG